MSIFGAANEVGVRISDVQRATTKFKARLARLVDLHGSSLPQLLSLNEKAQAMADDAYFMILPAPVDSAEELEARQLRLRRLNDPAANVLVSYRF